jgi:hypothetical protein
MNSRAISSQFHSFTVQGGGGGVPYFGGQAELTPLLCAKVAFEGVIKCLRNRSKMVEKRLKTDQNRVKVPVLEPFQPVFEACSAVSLCDPAKSIVEVSHPCARVTRSRSFDFATLCSG